jgi:hypothetical protein
MWLAAIHLKLPLAVCWTTEWVYMGSLGVLSFFYFRRGSWKNKEI